MKSFNFTYGFVKYLIISDVGLFYAVNIQKFNE
jgi:hypothetical protein